MCDVTVLCVMDLCAMWAVSYMCGVCAMLCAMADDVYMLCYVQCVRIRKLKLHFASSLHIRKHCVIDVVFSVSFNLQGM